MTTVQVSDAGEIALPPEICNAVGIQGRSFVVIEQVAGGILVRPVTADVEIYTPERKAEFLLTNAANDTEYAAAVAEVRGWGLDPDRILHRRPSED